MREPKPYYGPDRVTVFMLPAQLVEWEQAWGQHLGQTSVEEDIDVSIPEREAREGRNPEYALAKNYASTYVGTFQFMLDMKAKVNGPKERRHLSDGMVKAILKCRQADIDRQARLERAAKERVQSGRDLTCLPIGRTYAAVDNDSDGVTFLIIDRPADDSKWSGWVFVKQQVSDNETKIGSQRPGETYVGQWANLIDRVLADPVAAVVRYGVELGKCGVCGRTLTNQASRDAGIGPVCLAKLSAAL